MKKLIQAVLLLVLLYMCTGCASVQYGLSQGFSPTVDTNQSYSDQLDDISDQSASEYWGE